MHNCFVEFDIFHTNMTEASLRMESEKVKSMNKRVLIVCSCVSVPVEQIWKMECLEENVSWVQIVPAPPYCTPL